MHLVVVATAATGAPLVGGAAHAAEACVRWTGAGGDERWDAAANWDDGAGGGAVPGPDDDVCVDTGEGGPLHAPDGIAVRTLSLEGSLTDPPVELTGVVVTNPEGTIEGTGRLVLSGVTSVSTRGLATGALEVPAGAVVSMQGTLGDYVDDPLDLDVAGTLRMQESTYLGSVTVRPGGRVESAFVERQDVQFRGDVDIRPGGAFVVGAGALVYASRDARLLGAEPTLIDVEIVHDAPFPLTVRGDVLVHAVTAEATLLVRPEGDRLSIRAWPGTPSITIWGTLDVVGVPGDTAYALPSGPIEPRVVNEGTVRLDGVTLERGLDNRGTASVRGSVRVVDGQELRNTGRLEVGPRFPGEVASPLVASLLVDGTLANSGTIVSTDPSAEISATRYEGPGTTDAWLNILWQDPGAGLVVTPGRRRLVRVLGLAGADLSFTLGGLTDATASRVVATGSLVDFGDPNHVDVAVPASYVACNGSRWQLAGWSELLVGYRLPSSDPSGNRPGIVRSTPTLSAAGLPAGVSMQLVERHDGLVAIVAGRSSVDGAACSDGVGARLVSGLFVDGLGRPPTPAQLATFGGRAASAAGRRSVARELLAGTAARERFTDVELRRILGRPASLGAQRSWAAALGRGRSPDELRAEAYAGTAFVLASGRTPDGWTRAFYDRELGRAPSSSELSAMRAALGRGTSRVDLARFVLAGREADAVLAGRSLTLWWARPSTAAERSTWATRYQAGPELTVTADLAAASPVT